METINTYGSKLPNYLKDLHEYAIISYEMQSQNNTGNLFPYNDNLQTILSLLEDMRVFQDQMIHTQMAKYKIWLMIKILQL